MLELNAMDRCDRCGAQAYYRAHKAGLEPLLFCNHHHREHEDKLLEQYWTIESDQMQSDPKAVAALSD